MSPAKTRSQKPLFSGVRKAVQRTRQMRTRASKAQQKLAAQYNAQTGEQYCPDHGWISGKDWPSHVLNHQIVEEQRQEQARGKAPGQTATDGRSEADKRRAREQRRNGAPKDPKGTDPKARKNSRDKADKQVVKDIEDRDTQVARAWEKRKQEIDAMTNGQGGGAMLGVCGAVAQAAVKWGDYQPQTREEMQHYLESSTRMFKVIADATRQVGQNMIDMKLHPAVARPIDGAADTVEEDRLAFTRAYVILCRIYQNRIEYEDQQGPKPEDQFWKSG